MGFDLEKTARQVSAEIPFYRWLYKGRDLSAAVPVFSKTDIWAYEEETGQPYYASPRLSEKPLLGYTSGTTGKVLPFPVTDKAGRGCENGLHGVATAFADFLGKRPVVCVLEDITEALQSICEQSPEMDFHVLGSEGGIEERLERAKACGANVLLDARGVTCAEIRDNAKNLPSYGIKILGGIFIDRAVQDFVRGQGVAVIFLYGSLDTAVFHAGCPRLAEGTFHLRALTSLHEVETDDGTLATKGEGRYVTTAPDLPFPLVRYTNGDRVRIEETQCACGFEGDNIVFLGRKDHIKLGSYGPPMNVMDVFRFFNRDPENFRTLVFYSSLAGDQSQHRLCVLLERDVSKPEPIERGWQDVMNAGAGGYDEGFKDWIKVVALPRGRLVADMMGNKQRVFIDAFRSEKGPLGEQAAAIIEEVFGEKLA